MRIVVLMVGFLCVSLLAFGDPYDDCVAECESERTDCYQTCENAYTADAQSCLLALENSYATCLANLESCQDLCGGDSNCEEACGYAYDDCIMIAEWERRVCGLEATDTYNECGGDCGQSYSYCMDLCQEVAVEDRTWGQIKSRYR